MLNRFVSFRKDSQKIYLSQVKIVLAFQKETVIYNENTSDPFKAAAFKYMTIDTEILSVLCIKS